MTDFKVDYEPFKKTELCEIMGGFGSDKGHTNLETSPHNYTTVYYMLFNSIRHSTLRVFELGLGTNNLDVNSNMGVNGKPGASLRGWRKFFPNASVYGADIDRRILFQEDRIKTYYCDQTDPATIKDMYAANPELHENFDIIIEDGWHTFPAQVTFFENSIHKVKKGGFYVIEDVHNVLLAENYPAQIAKWKSEYPDRLFWVCRLPSKLGALANNLIIVQNSASA
jgi:hypothetical protein